MRSFCLLLLIACLACLATNINDIYSVSYINQNLNCIAEIFFIFIVKTILWYKCLCNTGMYSDGMCSERLYNNALAVNAAVMIEHRGENSLIGSKFIHSSIEFCFWFLIYILITFAYYAIYRYLGTLKF